MSNNRKMSLEEHEMTYDDEQFRKYRNADGSIILRNPHIDLLHDDILYHFNLRTSELNFEKAFGDVKVVVMGGSADRMHNFARFLTKELSLELTYGTDIINITESSQRFAMYKVGPVICVSHGMGQPSMLICLEEMIKLLYHAKAKDPVILRFGSCGGLGLAPGSLIVSERTTDTQLHPYVTMKRCGKDFRLPAFIDPKLSRELFECASEDDGFETVLGVTVATDDFYEAQGRTDGAFCDHTEEEKMVFLKHLHANGVRNMEMETLMLAAMTYRAGIRATSVCVSFVDRFHGDQVQPNKEHLAVWQKRPYGLLTRFIKKRL